MADQGLDRCRILVVEDEYLLADELSEELIGLGATVIGPVSSVRAALDLIGAEDVLDGAILDVNLGGEPAFQIADRLIGLNIPIVFTTGYDAAALPDRFQHLPRCEKPVNIVRITAALDRAIHA